MKTMTIFSVILFTLSLSGCFIAAPFDKNILRENHEEICEPTDNPGVWDCGDLTGGFDPETSKDVSCDALADEVPFDACEGITVTNDTNCASYRMIGDTCCPETCNLITWKCGLVEGRFGACVAN